MDESNLLLSGTHKDFSVVLDSTSGISDSAKSKLKEGDMILRGMDMNKMPFYHVGIYCGKNEVIDFAADSGATQGTTGIISASFAYVDGIVHKVGVNNFLGGKPCRVLRSASGVTEGFADRVMTAMDSTTKYNAMSNNCLHFAMGLLGKKT